MQSLAKTNEDIKTSISLLENAKTTAYNRIGYYNYQMMEDRLVADDYLDLIKLNTLSINLLDVMIELTRSGLDILSSVNNKNVALSNILSEY